MTVELSILLAGIGLCATLYYNAYNKNKAELEAAKNEAKAETANSTMVLVKLENISEDIKDIKREYKDLRTELTTFRERIILLDASLKRAHERVDHVEGKSDGGSA